MGRLEIMRRPCVCRCQTRVVWLGGRTGSAKAELAGGGGKKTSCRGGAPGLCCVLFCFGFVLFCVVLCCFLPRALVFLMRFSAVV